MLRDEVRSALRLGFDHYLRTGERLTDAQWRARFECKFNPYHDERGRFTSPPGVTVSYGRSGAGMADSSNNVSSRTVTPKVGSAGNFPANQNARNIRKRTQELSAIGFRGKVIRQSNVLPSPSLLKRARAVDKGRSELLKMPHMNVVLFGPGTKLVPVPVASLQEFDSAAKLATRISDLDAVITGPQFDIFSGSQGLLGQARIAGRTYGRSAPDRYYVSNVADENGSNRIAIGKGDPPGTGVGGGIPLIINGQDVSGYDLAWRGYENSGTGKNIVAYNSVDGRLAVFVQPNGKEGYPIVSVRNYIKNSGYNYAIAFDGSGLVSLNYQGNQVVSADIARQPLIPLGIGFRVK